MYFCTCFLSLSRQSGSVVRCHSFTTTTTTPHPTTGRRDAGKHHYPPAEPDSAIIIVRCGIGQDDHDHGSAAFVCNVETTTDTDTSERLCRHAETGTGRHNDDDHSGMLH